MGLWDDVKKAGRLYSDVVGDNHFNFNCPNCHRGSSLGGQLFTPKSQAEAVYRAHPITTCPYCHYEFGIDPYSGYVRCTCGSLCKLVDGFEGVYRCDCDKLFAVQRRDSSDVYLRCFNFGVGSHSCTKYSTWQKHELEEIARNHRPMTVSGCGPKTELMINDALKHQLPNFVDRTETAVLPLFAIHDLQRQEERRLRAQLESFGPLQSAGRKVTYRRIIIDSNGVIAEELIIE